MNQISKEFIDNFKFNNYLPVRCLLVATVFWIMVLILATMVENCNDFMKYYTHNVVVEESNCYLNSIVTTATF